MQLGPQFVKKEWLINQVTSAVSKQSNINQTELAQSNLSGLGFLISDSDSSAQFSWDSCWSSLDQRSLGAGVTVSFFSLTRPPFFKRLNLPLSVSKPTVICPEFLWEVRWLPRLSQPVQCKDRKSQGSTPHTPTSNPYNFNAVSRPRQIKHKHLSIEVLSFFPSISMTLFFSWT